MSKAAFTSLLFGSICMLAVATWPQIPAARAGARPVELLGARKAQAFRHRRHFARHIRRHPALKRLAQAGNGVLPPDPPAPPLPPRAANRMVPRPTANMRAERPGAGAAMADKAKTASRPQKEVVAAQKNTGQKNPMPGPKSEAAKPLKLPQAIRDYCMNNVAAATDARVAWQATKLKELTAKLQKRIAQLEAKRAQYEDWLRRHEEAMEEAKKDVVAIYSRMQPDAAAAQLQVMDEVTAAALLSKIKARIASAILAEMDPSRAALISNAMIGPVAVPAPPVVAPAGKKS